MTRTTSDYLRRPVRSVEDVVDDLIYKSCACSERGQYDKAYEYAELARALHNWKREISE